MSSNKPVLGRLQPNKLKNPLSLAKKVMREGVLQQSFGADFLQEAIVVDIDPIGGMFSEPGADVGNPRFSLRVRLLEQTGENTNKDTLRSTSELKVCFPSFDMYHSQMPIKIGEKVWTFEKQGINGTSQRFWQYRSPTPVVLDTSSEFSRPTNNYANASFEANMYRPSTSTASDSFIDVNRDAAQKDIVSKLSERNADFTGDLEESDRSTSYFSSEVDRDAFRFGFVNEDIPELFTRPSDYVSQGSNNNALILGTNAISIESDSEAPDISDIISIYGFTNDASGFTNSKDPEITLGELSPIAANATGSTAIADLVVGRKYNFISHQFDSSRIKVFENIEIDSLYPDSSELISNLEVPSSPYAPAALLRSDNLRLNSRNSALLSAGTSCGIYLDNTDDGQIKIKGNSRYDLEINDVKLSIEEGSYSLDVGGQTTLQIQESFNIDTPNLFSVSVSSNSIALDTSGVRIVCPSVSIGPEGAPFISFGAGSVSIGGGGSPISLGGTGGSGVATFNSISSIVAPFIAALNAQSAALSSPLPASGPQVAALAQTLISFLQQLSSPTSYSSLVRSL